MRISLCFCFLSLLSVASAKQGGISLGMEYNKESSADYPIGVSFHVGYEYFLTKSKVISIEGRIKTGFFVGESSKIDIDPKAYRYNLTAITTSIVPTWFFLGSQEEDFRLFLNTEFGLANLYAHQKPGETIMWQTDKRYVQPFYICCIGTRLFRRYNLWLGGSSLDFTNALNNTISQSTSFRYSRQWLPIVIGGSIVF